MADKSKTKLYRLGRDFFNSRGILQERGKVVQFEEGVQPSSAFAVGSEKEKALATKLGLTGVVEDAPNTLSALAEEQQDADLTDPEGKALSELAPVKKK